jgi:hypothetical protein
VEIGEFFQAICAVGVAIEILGMARAGILHGSFCFVTNREPGEKRERGNTEFTEMRAQRSRRDGGQFALAGEGEDEEVAFAGDYDGEEAAVGGDGEVAEGEPVEDGDGLRLRNWNFLALGGWA